MVWFLIPQMDPTNNFGAFFAQIGILGGLAGVAVSFWRILDAYVKNRDSMCRHHNNIKRTFALFNEHYWHPDYNMRDLQQPLKEAKRLGIDKELPTALECRIYLYGYDTEENRPPLPKFNSNRTMIEVNGMWRNIPRHYYGRLMDADTVKQILTEIRNCQHEQVAEERF